MSHSFCYLALAGRGKPMPISTAYQIELEPSMMSYFREVMVPYYCTV